MPTTVYLIRHGETDANRARRVQGRGLDMALNATGAAQADRLGERLAGVALDAVHASPLVRARQTADAVAARHGLDVQTDADLEEIGWGVLEGRDATEATNAAFGDLYRAWDAGDFDACLDGGESAREVQRRVLAAWHRIVEGGEAASAEADRHIVVVSHGRTIRVLLASLLRADAPEALAHMHDYQHANTSVNVLDVGADGRVGAVRLNCTAHLPPALRTLPPTTGRAGSFDAGTSGDERSGMPNLDRAAAEVHP